MCHSIHVAVNTWLNRSFFTFIYSNVFVRHRCHVTVFLQYPVSVSFYVQIFYRILPYPDVELIYKTRSGAFSS